MEATCSTRAEVMKVKALKVLYKEMKRGEWFYSESEFWLAIWHLQTWPVFGIFLGQPDALRLYDRAPKMLKYFTSNYSQQYVDTYCSLLPLSESHP